jgi:hypothetical protein
MTFGKSFQISSFQKFNKRQGFHQNLHLLGYDGKRNQRFLLQYHPSGSQELKGSIPFIDSIEY